MRKYWAIFKIVWQNSFEYRADFFGHMALGLIDLAVLIYIWGSVFKANPSFSGYTFPTMITYLVLTKFYHFATRGNTARRMADEIKNGELSRYLLKPISYLRWWFSYFWAERLFEVIARLTIIALAIILIGKFFALPKLFNLTFFILFIPIALCLNLINNYLIAVCAFWITDVRLFSTTVGLIVDFLSGSFMPIDVFPNWLKRISELLPFQYAMYFPIKIYQGTVDPLEILKGLAMCFLWLFIAAFVTRKIWLSSLRKYEAVGQ